MGRRPGGVPGTRQPHSQSAGNRPVVVRAGARNAQRGRQCARQGDQSADPDQRRRPDRPGQGRRIPGRAEPAVGVDRTAACDRRGLSRTQEPGQLRPLHESIRRQRKPHPRRPA